MKKMKRKYGARRISERSTAQGESCGRTKVARLVALAGVSAKRRKKLTTFSVIVFFSENV